MGDNFVDLNLDGTKDQHSSKHGSTASSLSNIPHVLVGPTDGCIVLGKSGQAGHTYNTRYRIDHKLQHKDMTADVLKETFLPCCLEENKKRAGSCLWAFFSSEAFLLSLHLLALALGVSKEALRIRDVDEDLELVHSLIETLAACVQITIRGISAFLEYRSIKSHVTSIEAVESSSSAKGSSLKCTVLSFCVLCGVLVVAAVSAMIAFKFLAHLGWTILSNNFVLVVAMVCAGLVQDRMDKVIAMIREDQHKAVLYEATLLLREAHGAFSSKTPGQYFYKVNTFLKSLSNTDLFDQPEHIRVMDKYQVNLDMLTTMEMQS